MPKLGPKVGGHLALMLLSANELGELLQWLCNGDSTTNIVIAIGATVCASTTLCLVKNVQQCGRRGNDIGGGYAGSQKLRVL